MDVSTDGREHVRTVVLAPIGWGLAVAGLFPTIGTTLAAPDSPTADSLAVQIVDQSFAVREDGSLSLTVELTGLADAAQSDATVTVTVHDTIADLPALTAAADGDLPQPFDSVVLPPEEQAWVAGGTESVTTVLSLPSGDLELGDAGIHPMVVAIEVDRRSASSVTFIDVVDDSNGHAPLATSILVSIDDPGPWPSFAGRSRASADIDRLAELAAAVDGPLSIDLPAGAVTAQMAGDGTTIGLAADSFRGDELIAGPALPLDPSAIAAVDLPWLFIRELRSGEDVVSAAIPRAVVSRAAWFADQPLSADGAAMLRDLGIRLVVMTDDVASGLGVDPNTRPFEVEVGPAGTLPATTISPLGIHLDPAGESTPNERAVRLATEVRLHHDTTGAPAMVLAAPGVVVPDVATTARFAELVRETPDLTLVPISRLPGSLHGSSADRPPPVALPERAGADLTARLADIQAVRDATAHARSMLTDPSKNATWQAELDAILSTTIDDDEARSRLDTVTAEVDTVLGAIDPPDPFTFTTTGTSSTLRLRLENTAAEPLEIIVHPRSSKLRFPEPRPRVEIPALGAEVVDIPVEARTNGTFTIEVDVMTPDGHQIAGPVVITARVSRFSGLSRVLTGGAVLVLASWWFSHLRRNRRDQAAATGELQIDRPPMRSAEVSPDAAETLASERARDPESAPRQPG